MFIGKHIPEWHLCDSLQFLFIDEKTQKSYRDNTRACSRGGLTVVLFRKLAPPNKYEHRYSNFKTLCKGTFLRICCDYIGNLVVTACSQRQLPNRNTIGEGPIMAVLHRSQARQEQGIERTSVGASVRRLVVTLRTHLLGALQSAQAYVDLWGVIPKHPFRYSAGNGYAVRLMWCFKGLWNSGPSTQREERYRYKEILHKSKNNMAYNEPGVCVCVCVSPKRTFPCCFFLHNEIYVSTTRWARVASTSWWNASLTPSRPHPPLVNIFRMASRWIDTLYQIHCYGIMPPNSHP